MVDDATFEREIVERSAASPVLVFLMSGAPLRRGNAILDRVRLAVGELVRLVVIDVQRSPEVSTRLGVASVPCLAAVSRGRLVGRLDGDPAEAKVVDFAEALLRLHNSTDASAVGGEKRDDSQHVAVAQAALQYCSNPVVGIAAVIVQLLNAGRISADDLAVIGVSPDEVEGLVNASLKGSSLRDFSYELEVQAALREHIRTIDEIGATLGLLASSAEMELLRQTIVEFALENNLADLGVAYRLLRAEAPDRLTRFGAGGLSAG